MIVYYDIYYADGDRLYLHNVTAKEVEYATGLKTNRVANYANIGTVIDGTYRIRRANVIDNQATRWDEMCKVARLIKNGDAKIVRDPKTGKYYAKLKEGVELEQESEQATESI